MDGDGEKPGLEETPVVRPVVLREQGKEPDAARVLVAIAAREPTSVNGPLGVTRGSFRTDGGRGRGHGGRRGDRRSRS
jgi:hypothetical protein